MGLSHDDVTRILKLIEESDFDALRLRMEGIELVVVRRGAGSSEEAFRDFTQRLESTPSSKADAQPRERLENAPSSTPAVEPPALSDADTIRPGDGIVQITAPTLGTLYVAPKPGAEPFVQEGAIVREDDTVCIIEVMKLFTYVKAGVSGRITKVCAKNGELVEHGQVLFLVSI